MKDLSDVRIALNFNDGQNTGILICNDIVFKNPAYGSDMVLQYPIGCLAFGNFILVSTMLLVYSHFFRQGPQVISIFIEFLHFSMNPIVPDVAFPKAMKQTNY